MKRNNDFFRTVCNLAIPVALQSMLQASFSIIDQIMIGQLGGVSVAAVGLAGKFSSIYSVLIAAIGTVAGIMISQYLGQQNKKEVHRSFYLNLAIGVGIAILFTGVCIVFPEQIMGLYSKERDTIVVAGEYLRIVAGTFLPMAAATLLSTMFRCMEKASLPLNASIIAAVANTGLNYIFIFGKFGCPQMGAKGAAYATLISQFLNVLIMLVLYIYHKSKVKELEDTQVEFAKFNWKQYAQILLPILICEFVWSLGENVYAAIYGHLGTEACAAMTLINPIQSLVIGALCGISQAASVIVGKLLGNGEYDNAYTAAKKLILYGLCGSVFLSVLVFLFRPLYVNIYQVEENIKVLTQQILVAYALIAPVKVLNMILGGGIIRSGGKTKYVMLVDMIGTWGFGVPLGLLAAFVFQLSIPYVYFILSLEECVRLGISFIIFKKKSWIQRLE